jgi:LPXTG-motif cell wall-anchored protein
MNTSPAGMQKDANKPITLPQTATLSELLLLIGALLSLLALVFAALGLRRRIA